VEGGGRRGEWCTKGNEGVRGREGGIDMLEGNWVGETQVTRKL
jgi:hypothetical protein